MKLSTLFKRRYYKYRKSFLVRLNTFLLVLFPVTENILAFVQSSLPQFAPYLPSNIYQVTGVVVVTINLWLARRAARIVPTVPHEQ